MNRRNFLTQSVILGGSFCILGKIPSTKEVICIGEDTYLVKVLKADVPNGAGHLYSMSVLKNIVKDFKIAKHAKKSICGRLEPKDHNISINELSHRVSDLFIDDGCLKAVITVLSTPRGQILKDGFAAGNKVLFRTTGLADSEWMNGRDILVGSNYKLLAIDAWPYYEDRRVVALERKS